MENIWVKDEEKIRKKVFLTIIVLVFTVLVGSTSLAGNPMYYLSFLASALTYYLLLDRKRVNGVVVTIIAFFVSGTFIGYINTLFPGPELSLISFKPLLLLLTLIITTMGLIPENVLSEMKTNLNPSKN